VNREACVTQDTEVADEGQGVRAHHEVIAPGSVLGVVGLACRFPVRAGVVVRSSVAHVYQPAFRQSRDHGREGGRIGINIGVEVTHDGPRARGLLVSVGKGDREEGRGAVGCILGVFPISVTVDDVYQEQDARHRFDAVESDAAGMVELTQLGVPGRRSVNGVARPQAV